MIMKAMIFAAGIGSRLKPFTDIHPKALAPVNGIPVLERNILKLKDAGITEIVINVHHFPDQIIDFLRANNNFGCTISISDEGEQLLDTGGGLLKAASLLKSGSQPVLLHNADIITDFPIEEMIECHKASGSDVTLMVDDRISSRMLYFDSNNMLQGWQNISTGQCRPAGFVPGRLRPLAFGGVHIMNPSVLSLLEDYSSPDIPFSIMPFYLDSLEKLKITGYTPSSVFRWHDIGTPEKLAAANISFSSK